MLFTVKEDLALMRELKLNPKQLTFVKMLTRDYSMDQRTWQLQSYAMSLEFQQLCPLTADDLADLIEREIILDLHDLSDSKIYYDHFELNPRYLRRFMLQVTGLASELFDLYPYEIVNGDLRFFAKDASADVIAPSYMKAINKSQKEHNAVIDDLKWAIKHNKLQCGIKKFVDTRFWLYIRDLRKRVNPIITDDARIG